jgi:tRNA-2-methylthio-N6-dimethylallyladenosine synthase
VFSPRPGTEAAAHAADFVAPDVVAERFDRLRVVVERSALAKHRARIGRIEEVLVEGPSKKDAAAVTGRTRQNKLVHFAPDGDAIVRPGAFADVRITEAGPHHLRGELVTVTATPRHRTRIPVLAG